MNQDPYPLVLITKSITRAELEERYPRKENRDKEIAADVQDMLNRLWRQEQERREKLYLERDNELANTIREMPQGAVMAIANGEINPLGFKDL